MHYQIRNCPHFCCGHVIPLFLHKQKEVVTRDAFSRVCSSKSHPAALIHAASFTCKAENTHTELRYKDRNLKRRCQHNAVQPERGTDVSKNVLHLQKTERQPQLYLLQSAGVEVKTVAHQSFQCFNHIPQLNYVSQLVSPFLAQKSFEKRQKARV